MPTKATKCRCCARSRPTATAWPAWRCCCPRAPPACRASSCRARPCCELRKLLDEGEGDVADLARPTPRSASPSATPSLTSKLIDGTFPDYDRVIPSGNDKILEVDCKDFAEAVDRVSTISTEKSRAVKLAIERGSLTLSATSPENGTATEEIEVRYTAPAARDRLQLALPARHHRADRGREARIPDGRCRLADLCATAPTRSALYVLMPMRV